MQSVRSQLPPVALPRGLSLGKTSRRTSASSSAFSGGVLIFAVGAFPRGNFLLFGALCLVCSVGFRPDCSVAVHAHVSYPLILPQIASHRHSRGTCVLRAGRKHTVLILLFATIYRASAFVWGIWPQDTSVRGPSLVGPKA
jgi:hypothetical protein